MANAIVVRVKQNKPSYVGDLKINKLVPLQSSLIKN